MLRSIISLKTSPLHHTPVSLKPWRTTSRLARRYLTQHASTQRRAAAQNLASQVVPRKHGATTKNSSRVGPSKRLLLPHVLSVRLKKLCEEGKINDAVTMLKNSPLDAQNTAVWNTLIWGCMKAKRFKLSYELFIDMKRRGFSPSTRTFQTMFSGLSRIEHWHSHPKQLANVHSLYEYFQRHVDAVKKHDRDSPALTITPIASYIKILGDAGEYQRMFDVYYALDQEGPLSPNQFVFTAMFQAISERRAPSDRYEPTTHTQNATDARLLWSQMLKASTKSPGFAVDPYITSAATIALSRGRPADQAFALDIVGEYLGLTEPGSPPLPGKFPLTVQTLAAALTLCNQLRNHKLCIHFFEQVKDRPEKSGGVSILDRGHMEEVLKAFVSLAALGSPDEPLHALRTLEWMLRQELIGTNGPKIRPAMTTYNLVLMACWRGADWTSATRTFELMTGYNAVEFGDERGSGRNPRTEQRPQGRNLIPDGQTMSCMIRTASASRNSAHMRQALRMVDRVGLDGLLGHNARSNEARTSKKASKQTTFYQRKLAAALVETINIILPTGKTKVEHSKSDEHVGRWMVMKTRANEFLRVNSVASEANGDDNEHFIEYEKPPALRHRQNDHVVTME